MRNPSGWFLGAKGGYNNESHNHNDVGSCVVYVRDIPVLVDAGVGTYTKQTFNHDRYKIWSMQCDWHNLPMINGTAQPAGAQYRSKNASCNLSKGMFSLDLADAYPPESGCRKWVRTYRLAPKGAPSVTITDSFALDARTQPDVEHFFGQGIGRSAGRNARRADAVRRGTADSLRRGAGREDDLPGVAESLGRCDGTHRPEVLQRVGSEPAADQPRLTVRRSGEGQL